MIQLNMIVLTLIHKLSLKVTHTSNLPMNHYHSYYVLLHESKYQSHFRMYTSNHYNCISHITFDLA